MAISVSICSVLKLGISYSQASRDKMSVIKIFSFSKKKKWIEVWQEKTISIDVDKNNTADIQTSERFFLTHDHLTICKTTKIFP